MERFRDKVVIITGGAGGIGRETALLISEEGGKVIIFDMNEIGLKEVEDTIKSRGRNCKGYKVDVSDFEIVQDAVNKVVEDFGKIDVLVNNAGITRDNFLTKMSVEDWNKVISIN